MEPPLWNEFFVTNTNTFFSSEKLRCQVLFCVAVCVFVCSLTILVAMASKGTNMPPMMA